MELDNLKKMIGRVKDSMVKPEDLPDIVDIGNMSSHLCYMIGGLNPPSIVLVQNDGEQLVVVDAEKAVPELKIRDCFAGYNIYKAEVGESMEHGALRKKYLK